jgi:hypothetical protein
MIFNIGGLQSMKGGERESGQGLVAKDIWPRMS